MQCSNCGKPGEKYLEKVLCSRCFCAMIERRVKKHAKILFEKGVTLGYSDELCKHLLKKFVNDPSITVVSITDGFSGVKILPWTMDHESVAFLKGLLAGDLDNGVIGSSSGQFKLLLVITDAEASRYATLNGLKYVACEKLELVEKLTSSYPQLKHHLGKSVRELGEILGKGI